MVSLLLQSRDFLSMRCFLLSIILLMFLLAFIISVSGKVRVSLVMTSPSRRTELCLGAMEEISDWLSLLESPSLLWLLKKRLLSRVSALPRTSESEEKTKLLFIFQTYWHISPRTWATKCCCSTF